MHFCRFPSAAALPLFFFLPFLFILLLRTRRHQMHFYAFASGRDRSLAEGQKMCLKKKRRKWGAETKQKKLAKFLNRITEWEKVCKGIELIAG